MVRSLCLGRAWLLAWTTALLSKRTPAHLDRIGWHCTNVFLDSYRACSSSCLFQYIQQTSPIGISPRMFPHIALMNFPGLSIKRHFDRRKRYLVWNGRLFFVLMQGGFLSLGHRVDERVASMLVCNFKGFSLRQTRLLTIHNCWSENFVLVEVIRHDMFSMDPWTILSWNIHRGCSVGFVEFASRPFGY